MCYHFDCIYPHCAILHSWFLVLFTRCPVSVCVCFFFCVCVSWQLIIIEAAEEWRGCSFSPVTPTSTAILGRHVDICLVALMVLCCGAAVECFCIGFL